MLLMQFPGLQFSRPSLRPRSDGRAQERICSSAHGQLHSNVSTRAPRSQGAGELSAVSLFALCDGTDLSSANFIRYVTLAERPVAFEYLKT